MFSSFVINCFPHVSTKSWELFSASICFATGIEAFEIRPSRKQSQPSRSVDRTKFAKIPLLKGIQLSSVTRPLPRRYVLTASVSFDLRKVLSIQLDTS